jgi:hypothetical protein
MLIPLGNIYLLANNSEAVLNLQVTAAETNPDGELALRDNPLLADNVPVAQVPALKLKGNLLALTLLKVDLLETAELANGCASRCGRGKADVKLRNSGTGNITSVGNRNSDVIETLPESGVTTGLDGELLRVGSDVVLKRGRLNVGDLKGGV